MSKKVAGIVCDNYKLDKFEKELIKASFTDYTIVPNLIAGTSIIKVSHDPQQFDALRRVIERCELHFKQSKYN